jgi:hypothetical protein
MGLGIELKTDGDLDHGGKYVRSISVMRYLGAVR